MEMILSLIPNILAAGLAAGTPVLLASLGEIIAEKAGILNIGLEGIMILGCVSAAQVALATQSASLGLATAATVGGICGLIHAFFCVTLKGNQIVSGLAMVLFGSGLSTILGKSALGLPIFSLFFPLEISGLSSIPLLGRILFRQDALTLAGLFLAPAAWFFLHRTRPGLLLRSVGESPETADSLGARIAVIRYGAIITGGMFAGAGGAFLSLAQTPSWVEGMTCGAGWISLAVAIFARWNPMTALMGAWLYGAVQALGFRLQAVGVPVASQFLNMLPYLAPIVVLMIAAMKSGGRSIAPRALGIPYEREMR